ncbi:MAG TPA: NAD(P)-dependent oxidoreductase [Planctomycetes bacterium]|nr:NAD(P)-dependent oxidoreductase [Planctomycetota bacterium]HIK82585.1 NAD(P)-dependent oxidoreductase [Planctomycetota bacterium]
MPPTVGWIGCGVMGKSMVKNLLRGGYSVGLYSRTRSAAQSLIDLGAGWYSSPMALAMEHEIIISMVGYPADVEMVYLGEKGVFSTSPDELQCHTAIDMTTSTPSLAVQLAEAAAALGIEVLDAPVSGGDVGAREGTLSIMVGGDPVALDRVSPIFQILGKPAILQGGHGAGQHTKMVNQIIIASTMIGICEGLVYARQSGLDPSRVLESVSGGAAGSWSLTHLAPRILAGDFEPGFYVEHFVKDLEIALAECDRMGIELRGLALARQLYQEVVQSGGARLGTQALHGAIENLARDGRAS